MLKDIRHYLK